MNLPGKFPTSKTREPESPEELAKWHCVLNLFGEATGDDPFLARNIKEAIDASLLAEEGLDASIDNFAEAALRLVHEDPVLAASYGLFHLELRGRTFDPLFVREELIAGLKRVAGYSTALVLVSGLRETFAAPSGRLTQPRREAHAEAKSYLESLAAEWTTENTVLTILYT